MMMKWLVYTNVYYLKMYKYLFSFQILRVRMNQFEKSANQHLCLWQICYRLIIIVVIDHQIYIIL